MLFKKEFKIGSINVGGDSKCIIIAEVSANHNNDYKIIKKLLNHSIRRSQTTGTNQEIKRNWIGKTQVEKTIRRRTSKVESIIKRRWRWWRRTS